MFLTSTYIPKSILNEFVVCFYFNELDNADYTAHCLPTLNQELFLNLGEKFEVENYQGRLIDKKNWLSGIQSKTLKVRTSGKHRTAGVIFKPWGLYAAFGINAQKLFNQQADSNILFSLQKELKNSDIPKSQFFDFMEYSLTKSLSQVRLTVTMQNIIKDLEREDLAELSEKLNRSKKSVIASFNKMVGVSPQKYYNLKRICDAIAVLINKPDTKLTDLAYNLGFYDQAHFTRAFKEHTGHTPKALKANNFILP